jgi:hypothetical protein
MATDVYVSAYQGLKDPRRAMGGKGKIVHLTGFLVDPNTQLHPGGQKRRSAKAIAR